MGSMGYNSISGINTRQEGIGQGRTGQTGWVRMVAQGGCERAWCVHGQVHEIMRATSG